MQPHQLVREREREREKFMLVWEIERIDVFVRHRKCVCNRKKRERKGRRDVNKGYLKQAYCRQAVIVSMVVLVN